MGIDLSGKTAIITGAGQGLGAAIALVMADAGAAVIITYFKDPEGQNQKKAEERAAEIIIQEVSKPVVAFITGRSAPPDKKMGHASAIISEGRGTFESKIKALKDAGVTIANAPSEVPTLVQDALSS